MSQRPRQGTGTNSDVYRNFRDVFENDANPRTNVLDIASHYPYSPERWRLFVNGTRQFPEYSSVAQYTHATDVHELAPAAGETVTFETAERPRYVVGYELAATMAFAVNQSLASGDRIRVGLYDGSDGWYMEHSGDQADDVADFVCESNGTEVYRKTDVNIEKAVTTFSRLKLETGWYKVTRQKWERSFPSDGTQQNPTIGKFSDDQNNGPEVGNLPIHFEVTADANTSGLILEAGSVAQVNLGQVTSQRRVKSFNVEHTFSTTGTWVPILAMRVDPDRSIINTQLQRLTVASWSGNDDVEILVQAHDPSKVLESDDTELDDADYSTPNVLSDQNNVIETSTALTQAPDNTGTPTTGTSNPGGFQAGFASSRAQQQGSGRSTTTSEVKRPIYGRDVAVVWGFADSTNTVVVDLSIEQDW